MDTVIHTYKEVYTSEVVIRADGSCTRKNLMKYHIRDVINKMACFFKDSPIDLCSWLYQETSYTSLAPGSCLYVASECKTGRDTFRNSGYSIKRDPDKAEAIVVPDVRSDYYHTFNCNLVAYDPKNENLHLIYLSKPGYLLSQLTENDLVNARTFLRDTWGLEPDEVTRSEITVWFIPKCQEIMDVLQDNTKNVLYIRESKVPLSTSTKISPETLVFWENVSDNNLFVRTVCTSDWMDYPITLLVHLSCFHGDCNWFAYANGDFRRILNEIGYKAYWNLEYLFQGRNITPKDFDMLQKYVFYKLGVDENGGFVKTKTFEKIPYELRRYIRRMTAIRPMTIPSTMQLTAIENLATS